MFKNKTECLFYLELEVMNSSLVAFENPFDSVFVLSFLSSCTIIVEVDKPAISFFLTEIDSLLMNP